MIPRARLFALSALSLSLVANVARAAWPHDPFVNLRVAAVASQQVPGAVMPDGAGGVFIVWRDSRGGNDDIYLQRLTAAGAVAGGWPVNGLLVCGAAGDQQSEVMVSDGAGGVIVAWRDQRFGFNGEIFAQRVSGGGAIAPGWPVDGRLLSDGTAAKDQIGRRS